MSKSRHSQANSLRVLISYIVPLFVSLFFLLPVTTGDKYSYASDFSSNNYQLTYEKNLVSISATQANLKSILTDIAEKADITMRYPNSFDKKVTLKVNQISLRKALKRLLKDFNYSIIYSGSKNRAVISDVYIFEKDQRSSRRTTPTSSSASRAANRIQSYERRIETLKKNLAKVDENSARGRRYLRQIESYEKTIERLKQQSD